MSKPNNIDKETVFLIGSEPSAATETGARSQNTYFSHIMGHSYQCQFFVIYVFNAIQ